MIFYLQENLAHENRKELNCKKLKTSALKSYVHGDFTVHNILIHDEEIVLLDWSSSRWVKHQFNFAPIYWDFIWFIQSVFLIPETNDFGNEQKREISKLFVVCYLSLTTKNSLEEIANYAIRVNRYFYEEIFLKKSKWYQVLRHRFKWNNCNRFWLKTLNEFS